MKVYRKFATDEDAEREGVWVALDEDARVKVARFNNPHHKKLIDKLRKPYLNMLRAGGTLPDAVQDKIAVEAMASTLLLDWDGLEDEDGKPIPYSYDNAVTLLRDLKDFRDQVGFLAMEPETFRKAALEAAAGNSPSAPRGRSKKPETPQS